MVLFSAMAGIDLEPGIGGDVGADGTRVDHREADVGGEQFGVETLGHQLDGGFAGTVNGLPGDGQETTHAGDVGDVGGGAQQQVGQEGFDHVERAVEIDAHDPLDGLVIQDIQLDKGLDDAGVVDDAVHLTMAGDNLGREGFDSLLIGDVQHVGGEFICLSPASATVSAR